MATTVSHRPPPRPLDLEITIVSAKHLKNVNWRTGDLNPYAIFWLDPDRRFATKSDDSNSTKPVWNERFIIPLSSSPATAVLTVEIFHSKPSDTPKPFVGAVRIPIADLEPSIFHHTVIRTFDLRRPSGRPNGKLRLKLAVRERHLPDYQNAPQPAYYYATTLPPPPAAPSPPPPPPHTYHYGSYPDPHPYSGYYRGGYYSPPPPLHTQRPFIERPLIRGGGGSGSLGSPAPTDYYKFERARETRKVPYGAGLGTGLAVGALSGGLAGLASDEGLRYEEEKSMRRVASDIRARSFDDYSDYHRMDY